MRNTLRVFVGLELVLIIIAMLGLAWEPGQFMFTLGFACVRVATISAFTALLFLVMWSPSNG